MEKETDYQLREAAGYFWLMNKNQRGVPYEEPLMLNHCGALIWKEYSAGRSIEQIAEVLRKTYGIDEETAKADATEFISQLCSQGIK